MLPSLKQRVVMLIAIVAGAWCLLMAEPALLRPDMGGGISLFYARSGWLAGLLSLVAAALPAIALGLVASGAAHPLAGLFTVCFSVAVLATAGGSIDGLLMHADGPGVFAALSLEVILWAALLVGVLAAIARSRLWIRRRFPRLTTEQHYGTATRLRVPGVDGLLTGLICASLGGLLSWVLLKSTDAGQVFGALLVGFAVAALVASQFFPLVNPVGILLSPCVVAVAAYLYAASHFDGYEQMMRAFNGGEFPSLARALPIHYASAGVAGCVLGVTLAQAIEHARHNAAEA